MKNEVDFLSDLGLLAFVTRLKRVSDAMLHDGRRLYRELGMDIEPNWYAIFKLLEHQGPFTVTEIADRIGFAHPSVVSILNKMTRSGYVEEVRVSSDSRKRYLKLTPTAVERLPDFERVWKAGTAGLKHMLDDTDALGFLERLEDRVTVKGFRSRALENYRNAGAPEPGIIEYRSEFAAEFARLNYDWISHYFEIEEHDRAVLDDPDGTIIARGGKIFLASVDGDIAGVVALINSDTDSFELAKMAVTPKYRGLNIGDKLLRACIDFAKAAGKRRLYLLSNTKLVPALRLYRKHGFTEMPLDGSTPYQRTDIAMELDLGADL